MRRRLCCAYNVSRGRANIGRIQALQAVACRGRVSPTSDINRRLMVAMTTIGIFLDLGYNMQDWCIASCISRGLDVVYISAGLSDSIRIYAGFRVLEPIFCFAGYDIATCNFEDCRGFGEFYS